MAEEKPVKEVQSLSNFIKEDKGNNTIRNAAIAGTLALGTVAAAVGLGAFRGSEPTPSVPPPPDKTAAAASPTPPEKTVVPTPSGKVEVTLTPAPTASPTPEVKKEVPCEALPKEVCRDAVHLEVVDDKGNIEDYIAFRNITPGTPISALFDGARETAQFSDKSQFKGSLLSIHTADRTQYWDFIGAVRWPVNTDVKNGQTIGAISDSSIKNYDEFTLLIKVSRRNPSTGQFESDKTTLQKFFQQAFDKDPVRKSKVAISSTIVTSPQYQDTGK